MEAERLDSDRRRSLLAQVSALQMAGTPEQADRLLRQALAQDPGDAVLAAALGRLLSAQGRWRGAAEGFALAALAEPGRGGSARLAWQAQHQAAVQGQQLRHGLSRASYHHWILQHESRLGDSLIPLNQEWWLPHPPGDGPAAWVALHAAVGSLPVAPQVQDPAAWPPQGWLVLLAPEARLRRGALQSLEHWLSTQPAERLPHGIYTDEDRLDAAGERLDPWFKPAWVEDSFWSTPWLDTFSCWNLAWLRHSRLPLPPLDPEARFAWLLEVLEQSPRLGHVPQVLVHRTPEAAVAASQPQRQQQRAQALQNHLQRLGEAVELVEPHPQLAGAFRLQWPVPAGLGCSVIVPSRDRADLLEPCLRSVERALQRQAGRLEGEILVVDNGSVEPATAELLEQWQQRLGDRFQVLRIDEPFNWSRLNNAAAAASRGELLLFLNNDVACRPDDPQQGGCRQNDDWLGRMAAQAVRPRVGGVGALLLYDDGTLQHGGVVVGMHGVADHAYRYLPPDHTVHRGRSRCHTAWGAVTGGCLMVRRELFALVGGFDQGLPVEGNDVDFCLRLGLLGYRHVIDPAVLLTHSESQSRDPHASTTAEAAYGLMRGRWLARLGVATPWWPEACSRDHADGRPRGLEFLL
ncbi:glycosyltransferase [Synechococcus sp. CBW1006]|uniref:glycosyltransferase n=1 Tax=Synechococcus sp. CBW1006 TaxID=1353138 RepID=UPI0018CD8D08|nr:glycosyltransferase [Synechococcus sp. CBW1006]QPN65892.1 glycosyltransferase [Synechococcus sp. CBW1006]